MITIMQMEMPGRNQHFHAVSIWALASGLEGCFCSGSWPWSSYTSKVLNEHLLYASRNCCHCWVCPVREAESNRAEHHPAGCRDRLMSQLAPQPPLPCKGRRGCRNPQESLSRRCRQEFGEGSDTAIEISCPEVWLCSASSVVRLVVFPVSALEGRYITLDFPEWLSLSLLFPGCFSLTIRKNPTSVSLPKKKFKGCLRAVLWRSVPFCPWTYKLLMKKLMLYVRFCITLVPNCQHSFPHLVGAR